MTWGAVLRPPGQIPIVLASASPRRLDLLAQIGLTPDLVAPADIDERPRRKELPRIYAARIADAKASTVQARHPGSCIVAADTVVACGRRILPKAESEAEARKCLELLSGRRHRVLGAVVILMPDGRKIERLRSSTVTFKRFEGAEIAIYLASGEWHGKAGGYAIQGLAAAFVRNLNGSYSNVVGLPLAETYVMLRGAGFSLVQTPGHG